MNIFSFFDKKKQQENMRSRKFGHFYNQLIQAWNTIFFGVMGVGGVALCYFGHYTLGVILAFCGIGGFYFCQKQLRRMIDAQQKEEESSRG